MTRASGTNGDRPPAGVHVLGMHRSGTSATTRLVNLLGVPMCRDSDLYTGVEWAHTGLWESRTLVKVNDALLRALGAEWWCPPRPNESWVRHPSITGYLDLARAVFERVHPARQWVWKDPRTCVTFPFWQRALDVNAAAILVLRHPLEVAASLAARNTFATAMSLALWERYLQNLVPHLRGLPVMVTPYEEVLTRPAEWCRTASRFLASHGLRVHAEVDARAVDAFIDPSLRHHVVADDQAASAELSDSQRILYDALASRVGVHDRFELPALPVETPATDLMFSSMRRARRITARSTGPLRRFDVLRGGPVPRTRPTASVVIISRNEGVNLRRTVDHILRTTPRDVELIVVDDASTDDSAAFLNGGTDRVTLLRSQRQLGVANARNLGARTAKGDIIVLCDAHIAAADGWFAPLVDCLAAPAVGAVGPVLRAIGRPDVKVCGLAFIDDALNVDWLPRRAANPYAVPLLPGCVLAVRHDVFHGAGGFDDGMLGYGAEDLELCMRIWRMGLECLVVPASEVGHRFTPPNARGIDRELFVYNLLRLGVVHLSGANFTRFIDALRAEREFEAAMARVLAGNTLRRRAMLQSQMPFDDSWFFRRFDAAAFRPAGGDSGVVQTTESERLVVSRATA